MTTHAASPRLRRKGVVLAALIVMIGAAVLVPAGFVAAPELSSVGMGGSAPSQPAAPDSSAQTLAAGAITPGSPSIDDGQSIVLTANPSGGTGPYTIAWFSSLDGMGTCPGDGMSVGSNSTTYDTGPLTSSGGPYYFCYNVTDSESDVAASAWDLVTVNPALGTAGVPAGTTPIDAGQTETVTADISEVTGTGTGTITYSLLANGDSTDASCVPSGSTLTCTYSPSAGSYTYQVTATDQAYNPATTTSGDSPPVSVSATLATPTISPTNPTIDSGQSVTFTSAWSGGTPDYVAKLYSGTSSVCDTDTMVVQTLTSLTTGSASFAPITPPASGMYYCIGVTDSATTPASASSPASHVTLDSELTAPGAPTITSNPVVDQGQTSTLTATIPSTGTSPYSWQWLYSTDAETGYSSATATQCATPSGSGARAGAVETCSFATSASIAPVPYYFEIRVTDSALTYETATSPASSAVSVNSALAAPAVPTVSATALDVDQTLTVSGAIPSSGTPTYAWTWWIGINTASYVAATQCAVNSGTGALGGATETCTISGGVLTVGDSYTFELKVTDSASTPETTTSAASSTVTVSSALATPTISPSSPTIDSGQSVTFSSTWSGGAEPFTAKLYSGSSSTCSSDTMLVQSQSSLTTGSVTFASVSPEISSRYCVVVTDSSSGSPVASATSLVTVNSALGTPTISPSNPTIDSGQSVTFTSSWSGGTPDYAAKLYSGTSATCSSDTTVVQSVTSLAAGSVTFSAVSPGTSTYYCIVVTDAATGSPAASTTSTTSMVTVNPALTAPAAPTPSVTTLDADQPLSVTGTVPSTGTPTYSWQWLISISGGAYADATQCGASASGSGASGGTKETCTIPGDTLTASTAYTFELKVTDSAATPETKTSSASSTVTTTSALTAGTPSPMSPAIDSGESVALTANPSGGSGGYTYQWYSGSTASGCTGLGSPISGATSATYSASPTSTTYYCYVVTDSESGTATSTADQVTVNPALTAPASPTMSATALDADQKLTVTGVIPTTGTPTYSWQWMISVNGKSFAPATQCAVNSGSGASAGGTETCNITAITLTTGDTYAFELKVTDSGSPAETQTSTASSTLTVNSALTPPSPPTVSATTLYADQGLTVTGIVPSTGTAPYAWEWLVSVNGGAFASASQCALSSGSGASAGTVETCSIGASTLTAAGTYAFELQVTDSASTPETQSSSPSSIVTLILALTAPAAPTVSATALDADQGLTVTGTIPSTGIPTYSWQWLVSINGGPYVDASPCAVSSGTGASEGATETCSIAPGALTAGDSYTFELQVTDSSSTPQTATSSASPTVTLGSTLTAGTPSPTSPAIDSGESVTLTANPSGGSGGYTYQWYSGSTASGCTGLGFPIAGATSWTYSASPTSTTYYCYVVTDSATSRETQTSLPVAVTVSSALTAPPPPTPSAPSLGAGQALTVTGTIPSTGTAPYTWQWLVSVNGGAYVDATQCWVNGGTGASAGAGETCSIAASLLTAGDTYQFELRVTDSATSPYTETSAATAPVTVAAPSSASWFWAYVGIALAATVSVVLVTVLAMRRRRPHAPAPPPRKYWEEGPSPPTGVGPAAEAPGYLETAADVAYLPPAAPSTAPPAVPPAVPSTAPPAVPSAAPKAAPKAAVVESTVPAARPPSPVGGAATDIDSVMAELETIRAEMAKRGPKKDLWSELEEETGEEPGK